jgi:hypothetical protein
LRITLINKGHKSSDQPDVNGLMSIILLPRPRKTSTTMYAILSQKPDAVRSQTYLEVAVFHSPGTAASETARPSVSGIPGMRLWRGDPPGPAIAPFIAPAGPFQVEGDDFPKAVANQLHALGCGCQAGYIFRGSGCHAGHLLRGYLLKKLRVYPN